MGGDPLLDLRDACRRHVVRVPIVKGLLRGIPDVERRGEIRLPDFEMNDVVSLCLKAFWQRCVTSLVNCPPPKSAEVPNQTWGESTLQKDTPEQAICYP